jgi:hypothetical protein
MPLIRTAAGVFLRCDGCAVEYKGPRFLAPWDSAQRAGWRLVNVDGSLAYRCPTCLVEEAKAAAEKVKIADPVKVASDAGNVVGQPKKLAPLEPVKPLEPRGSNRLPGQRRHPGIRPRPR